MAQKRNYEWPQAIAWNGFFTQDKVDGITERVDPATVMERLRGAGFLDDEAAIISNALDAVEAVGYILPLIVSPLAGQSLRYSATSGKWENADPFPVVTNAETSGAIALQSNKYIQFGTLSSVAFSLVTPSRTDIVNEYRIKFVAGASTAIIWPSDLKWLNGTAPTITSGKTYEISILEGLAICAEFA